MDEQGGQYLDNMDETRRTQSFADSQYQERPIDSSQAEVLPPRKTHTSLFLLSESNVFRRHCTTIVESKVSFCI